MAIFDEIGRKISSAGQSVVKGTKDFADVTRLNSLVADEQKLIADGYEKLGQQFYEAFGARLGELGTAGGQFRETCGAITGAFVRISQYQSEIQQIKGVKICSNCNADIPQGSAFCGSCGAPVAKEPESESSESPKLRFCMSCGTQAEPAASFCTACGKKLE